MVYRERLYDIRLENRLRQADIAAVLDTTKQSYSCYENGKRKLGIEDLILLCKHYNLCSDYILGLADERRPLRDEAQENG